MSPKRKESDDSDQGSSTNSTPKKQRTSNGKRPWDANEEHLFLEYIDQVVRPALWTAVKADPALSSRGARGIRSHWEAIYKQLKKNVK